MKRILVLLAAVATIYASSTSAAPIKADIVLLVDNSYSMSNEIPLLRRKLAAFEEAMQANGIDAQYAVVKFGYRERVMTDLVPYEGVQTPLSRLRGMSDNPERGSKAVNVALSQISFRDDAVKNIILFTDEDDDSTLAEFQAADAALSDSNAFFNYVGRPGLNNTDSRYGALAAAHRGTAFDIVDFVADPDPFFANFIEIKLREIQTPEPGTIVLLAAGSVALLLRRRRKISA